MSSSPLEEKLAVPVSQPNRIGWSFYLILAGQFVSLAGSSLTRFALGVWLYQRSGSATEFSLNAVAAAVPYIALTPFAGPIADRWNRRLVLLLSTTGAALSILSLALVLTYSHLESWHVYLVTAASAACAAFQGPAFLASIPQLVARHELGRANGLVQLTTGVTQILAPFLAGALLLKVQLGGLLVFDFFTFLVAIGALFAVSIPQPEEPAERENPKQTLLQSAAAGWLYLSERKGLFHLMVLFGVINFFMGMVQTLATPLVLSVFHPAALGSVMTLGGIGVLVAGLSLKWFGRPGRRTWRLLWFAASCGFFLVTAGVRPSLPLVTVSAFGLFFCLELVNGCSTILLQTKVEPAMQGRVFSLSALLANASMPLAYLVAGPLADHWFEPWLAAHGRLAGSVGLVLGTGPGRGIGLLFMVLGGAVMLAVAGGWLQPRLRNLDVELPEVGASGPESGSAAPALEGTVPPLAAANLVEERSLSPRENRWAAGTLVGALAIGCGVVWFDLTPPPVKPATAPATEFSAVRAFEHLPLIASQPHPMGSPAHAEVRAYLTRHIKGLGLTPQVQVASAVLRKDDYAITVGDVQNVVVRLAGTNPTKAVLLVAHYDSVPSGPGASDDGAGVAALLETLRALQAGPRLRNDVIFLFTDGEEMGLIGAQAFVNEHPWKHEVGVVLNFEAVGTGGQSLMFETSAGNSWMIKEMAQAGTDVQTNSFFQEAYKLLPNLTDFKVFKEAGLKGLNFAYIDRPFQYHSEHDTIENLDQRSLQHHGAQALALARRFGQADFNQPPCTTDAVYFTVLRGWLVRYSKYWALVWADVLLVGFWLAYRRGIAQGRITRRGVLIGCGGFLLTGFLIAFGIALFWWVTGALRVVSNPVSWSDFYHLDRFQVGFGLYAVLVMSVVYSRLRHRVRPLELLLGGLSWWVLLGLVTGIFWPGASYLFVWPAFFALLGTGLFRLRQSAAASHPIWFSAVCGLPGLILLAPLFRLLTIGLPLELAPASSLFLFLIFSLFLIPFACLPRWTALAVQLGAGLGCVGFLVSGLLVSAYDAGHKQPDSLLYVLHTNTQKAIWASTDEYPDPWTGTFFQAQTKPGPVKEFFPEGQFQLLFHEAPVFPLAEPRVEVLEDSRTEQGRLLRVQVRSARQAAAMKLVFKREPGLKACRLNGKPLDLNFPGLNPAHPWVSIWYWAFPEKGMELTFEMEPGGRVQGAAADITFELPHSQTADRLSRPQAFMPMPHGFGVSDRTMALNSFAF
ncbi:MAG: MFS transporter [Blastocatellia bacterium]|nr:MFS transporter [Blastocatellia bacterium]